MHNSLIFYREFDAGNERPPLNRSQLFVHIRCCLLLNSNPYDGLQLDVLACTEESLYLTKALQLRDTNISMSFEIRQAHLNGKNVEHEGISSVEQSFVAWWRVMDRNQCWLFYGAVVNNLHQFVKSRLDFTSGSGSSFDLDCRWCHFDISYSWRVSKDSYHPTLGDGPWYLPIDLHNRTWATNPFQPKYIVLIGGDLHKLDNLGSRSYRPIPNCLKLSINSRIPLFSLCCTLLSLQFVLGMYDYL